MQERIRTIRKTLKLTLTEFAERIGVTNPAVSYWEHGRPVPESRIKAICKEFNVNEEWLRTGVGEMFVEKPKTSLQDYSNEELLAETCRRITGIMPSDIQSIIGKVLTSIGNNDGDPTRAYDIAKRYQDKASDRLSGKDDNNETA